MIAASILEYMFISVTCCEEIAKKKLLEHFTIIYTHDACILASASLPSKFPYFPRPRTCTPNSFSRTFKVPDISQTQLQGMGNL